MRARLARGAGVIATCLVLVCAQGVAHADDPEPTNWPTVDRPATGGGTSSDPEPVKWPSPKNL